MLRWSQSFNPLNTMNTVEQMSYQHARTNMVKQQLRTGDVLEESILSLYDLIPRHEFVPEQYTQFAYSDMQIPLGHGQRMLTPLEEGIIPPTINIDNQDPECDLDYIANVARKANLTTVMSNNFGFGGTNGSVIFRRYEK